MQAKLDKENADAAWYQRIFNTMKLVCDVISFATTSPYKYVGGDRVDTALAKVFTDGKKILNGKNTDRRRLLEEVTWHRVHAQWRHVVHFKTWNWTSLANVWPPWPGSLPEGNDRFDSPQNLTLAAANAVCASDARCHGFTYKANLLARDPEEAIPTWFKDEDQLLAFDTNNCSLASIACEHTMKPFQLPRSQQSIRNQWTTHFKPAQAASLRAHALSSRLHIPSPRAHTWRHEELLEEPEFLDRALSMADQISERVLEAASTGASFEGELASLLDYAQAYRSDRVESEHLKTSMGNGSVQVTAGIDGINSDLRGRRLRMSAETIAGMLCAAVGVIKVCFIDPETRGFTSRCAKEIAIQVVGLATGVALGGQDFDCIWSPNDPKCKALAEERARDFFMKREWNAGQEICIDSSIPSVSNYEHPLYKNGG